MSLIGVLAAGACALITLSTTAANAAPDENARGEQGQKHAAKHPKKPGRPHHLTRAARGCPSSCCRSTTSTATSSRRAAPRGRNTVDHKLGPDPVTGVIKALDVTEDAGGAAYLATHLEKARKGHRNSLTVAAGDLIGASPLLSAAFHDEPTVESMNKLGLDASAVGNHEFDEGYKELQRMDEGRLHRRRRRATTRTPPGPQVPRRGLRLPRRQREVRRHRPDDPPPYTIKKVHGAKIGFIGMTLEDTPDIVTASGRRRPGVQGRGADRQRAGPRAKRRASRRSSTCPPGRQPRKQKWTDPSGKVYKVNPNYDYTCDGDSDGEPDPGRLAHRADRLGPRPRDRHGGHRPHPPALCLRCRGPQGKVPPGHLGLVLRPPVHRDQPEVRPPEARHRPLARSRAATAGHPRRAKQDPRQTNADQHVPRGWSRRSRARCSAAIT